jgi:hypothetical protein
MEKEYADELQNKTHYSDEIENAIVIISSLSKSQKFIKRGKKFNN